MRSILFPLQKLLVILMYVEAVVLIDPRLYLFVTSCLLLLSMKFEGARPYTPLLFLVLLLESLGFSFVQLILVTIAGLAMILMKLYDINVPEKGEYGVGHRYLYLQRENPGEGKFTSKLQVSVFYPCQPAAKGKKVEWIPNHMFNRVLYEIFYSDPKTRRIPYQLFTFAVSFIHKVYLPAQGDVPFCPAPNSGKIILLSHALGAHINAYSSLCGHLASHGYIILSANHVQDQVCIDYRVVSHDDEDIIRDFLFKERNKDLLIRRKQVLHILDQLHHKNLLHQVDERIQTEEVILAGHSYGGGTVLDTWAELKAENPHKIPPITRAFLLDPWFFPLDDGHMCCFQDEDILMINSNYFFREVPKKYELEAKLKLLHDNTPNLKAMLIRQMDHTSQSDMAYVFGNIMTFTNTLKKQHLTDELMTLNFRLIHGFLGGKRKGEILDLGNQYCAKEGIDGSGIRVLEEFRFSYEETMKPIV